VCRCALGVLLPPHSRRAVNSPVFRCGPKSPRKSVTTHVSQRVEAETSCEGPSVRHLSVSGLRCQITGMKDAPKSDTDPLPMNHELFQFVRNDLWASTINSLPLTNDFKRWFEWLEFIDKQVTELCVGRMVYSETRENVQPKP